MLFLLFVLGGVFYTFKDSNLYWLPSEIRSFLYPSRFSPGDCIVSKQRWAINPKKVIGLKFKGRKTFYLLRDLDKHQHDQLVFLSIVDEKAEKIRCRN